MRGIICDRRVAARVKGRVSNIGLETAAPTKRQEVMELNTLMRGTSRLGRVDRQVRQAGLNWSGHTKRRNSEGSWRWSCQQETREDAVEEDMQVVGGTEEAAEDRLRQMMRCSNP